MGANDILYKFVQPTPNKPTGDTGGATELIQSVIQQNQTGEYAAKVPVPSPGVTRDINIVKQFRWTKSALTSITVENTPTITLREMQVVSPAFFHNMTTMLNQIVGKNGIVPMTNNALRSLTDQSATSDSTALENNLHAVTNHAERVAALSLDVPSPQPKANLITNFISSNQFLEFTGNLQENMKTLKKEFEKFKFGALNNTLWNWADYLKEYENIYGVNPTNFLYRLPYLEDNYKQISNSWGNDTGGMVTQTISKIGDLLKLASPAVGVDLAKSYNYPDSGPSHDVNFFLDNTVIDGVSHAEKNYRLIYLLIYFYIKTYQTELIILQ